MATEYSAEWVKVPDGNGGQRKVWLRDSKARKTITDKFGIVEGTMAADANFSAAVSYPSGFTQNNCILCAFCINRDGLWRTGDGLGSGSTQCFAQMTASGVRAYTNAANCYSRPWRVVLMRIDI